MLSTPNRISGLIEKIEGGGEISQDELNRLASLQALDVANLGRQYVEESVRADTDQRERLLNVE